MKTGHTKNIQYKRKAQYPCSSFYSKKNFTQDIAMLDMDLRHAI